MKKSSLAVLVLLTGVAGIFIARQYGSETPAIRQAPSIEGLEEDPRGRIRFEYLRTRNPHTGEIPKDIKALETAFAKTLPDKEALIRSGRLAKAQLLTWNAVGPYNVGGRTRALGIDINNNYILAGGVSGGMYRSTDGGATWTNTTNPGALHSSTCICQDTRSGKTATWYYGTGEYTGNSASGGGAYYSGDGIFKSTDQGLTWTLLNSTSSSTPHSFDSFFDYIWRVVVDQSNASQDEVYAATYGTIQKSTNGGFSWTPVLSSSSPYSNFTDVAITSNGVLYATLNSYGSSRGIWRSTDGTNWTNITPTASGWPAEYRRVVLAIAPSNEDIVYFLATTPGYGKNGHSFWKYTYVSGDGSGAGGSWQNRSINLPADGGNTGNFDSQNGYDLVVKVKPDDPNTVFIGGTVLYRSTDGFASMANTTRIGGYASPSSYDMISNHFCDQHDIQFIPGFPARMISSHDGGLSLTTNCTSPTVIWGSLNNAYHTTQFYTIGLDHSGTYPHDIIGGLQDNGTYFVRSSSPTTSWTKYLSGDGAFCAIANNGTTAYTSSQNGVMYMFTIGASGNYTNWTRIDPLGSQVNNFINPFIVDPNNGNLVYMIGRDRIWRNSNASHIGLYANNQTSVNWSALTNVAAQGDTALTALEVTTSNPANRLYYGTKDGYIYRIDNANTGNPAVSYLFAHPDGAYLNCLAADPENGDRVLAVFSNYSVRSLYMTTNGGSTWTDISGNLEEYPSGAGNGPSCRWAEIVHSESGTVYFMGTSTGLYSTSALNGQSTVWAQEGASVIGSVVVDMIDSRESDGVVVIGTHGKGVFKAAVTTEVEEAEQPAVPGSVVLRGNYPNPFNPVTKITYELNHPAAVTLVVYDLKGRSVKTLVDGTAESGSHTVTWNGTDDTGRPVSSGVYIYRLEAGGIVRTGRCTLVK
ncbi:T9SS type A sorting domain-containing protein [bacterium]|nr:T9SS type A sorting domain-containing protein [bacterium]